MFNSLNSNMNSTINSSIMSDAMSEEPSSPESAQFDDSDLLHTVQDVVTAQLAAAGPVGVAAAAAIASAKRGRRIHSFETNPSIRKRQQTRLIRKLKNTIEEYTTRVGQQAIVLCCVPGKNTQSSQGYRVFGSQPLENVIKSCRPAVMQELEQALAQQAPASTPDNPHLHELPPLVIEGIPTPVDKMTQAQLRAFIPEMLKYSSGRSKPGWGKVEWRPIWWPNDVPWANVRSDVRSEEEKRRVSWTHALRTIVKNCYKHHCREDLLPIFNDDDLQGQRVLQSNAMSFGQQTMVQTINNPDGTVSIIHIDTGDGNQPQIVTLADGTQAQLVHTIGDVHGDGTQAPIAYITPLPSQNQTPTSTTETSQATQVLTAAAAHNSVLSAATAAMATPVSSTGQVVSAHQLQTTIPVQAHLNNDTASIATITPEGQLILAGDPNGLGAAMVTIPVSMYQTVVSSMPHITDGSPQTNSSQQIQLAMANMVSSSLPEKVEPIDGQLSTTQDAAAASTQPQKNDTSSNNHTVEALAIVDS